LSPVQIGESGLGGRTLWSGRYSRRRAIRHALDRVD